jgi:6-phosphofructokinase 1
VRPIAFDLTYATILGTGVMKLFQEGASGCMVTQTPAGDILPLYMKDVEDENGKVKPRLVNMNSEKVKLVFENNLHYITQNDYKAAKKYVSDPEEYNFKKILNW